MVDDGKKKKFKKLKFVVGFMILISILIYFYPTYSEIWNQFRAAKIIAGYKESTLSIENTNAEREAAIEYNRRLGGNGFGVVNEMQWNTNDPEYETLLNVNANGSMGYLDIPKIAVQLPIYHYYSDEQSEGLGHMHGSSLPIGGEGTHAVLAAHRGLPSAKLLTDLDDMDLGDMFYIHVLDETLAYQVDDIQVILPEDISQVQIEAGKDYVTLVTCTPYAVNTHRLLVRGIRVEYKGENTESTILNNIRHHIRANQWIGIIVLLAMLGVYIYKSKQVGKGKKHV